MTRNLLDNPFLILGIPTSASPREVRRRLDELHVLLGVGAAPEGLTSERLLWAKQALEDPVQRLKHEFFWVLTDKTEIPDGLFPGDGVAAGHLLTWLSERSKSGWEPDASIAAHDLGVLSLRAYLTNPVDTGQIAPLLRAWRHALVSPAFWSRFATSAQSGGDPRLLAAIDKLRDDAPKSVLDVLVEATESGRVPAEHIPLVVRAIRESGFEQSAIDVVARKLSSAARLGLREAIDAFTTTLNAIAAGDGAVRRDSPGKIDRAFAQVREQVWPSLDRLRDLDPEAFDASLADELARTLARLAFATVALGGAPLHGLTAMRESLATVQSASVKADLEDDNRKLLLTYHTSRAHLAGEHHDWIGLGAHLELAAALVDDPYERTQMVTTGNTVRQRLGPIATQVDARKRQIQEDVRSAETHDTRTPLAHHGPATPQTARSTPGTPRDEAVLDLPQLPDFANQNSANRRRGPGSILGLLAALIIAAFLAFNTGWFAQAPAGNSAPPTRQTSGPSPTSTPTCQRTVALLDAALSRIENEIEQIEAQMRTLDAEMEPLIVELDWINANYPNGAPQDIVDRYNYVLSLYSPKESSYNALLARRNAKVSEYNRRVDERNDTAQRC